MAKHGNKVLIGLCLLAIFVLVLPKQIVWAAANGLLPIPQIQGQRDQGTSVQGFPFLIAGSDGTNVENMAVTTGGVVKTTISGGIVFTNQGTKTSNGATAVVIVAASGTLTSFLGTATLVNSGTVTHSVSIISSGGTVLAVIFMGPNQGFTLDYPNSIQSQSSEGLSFKIDAGGAATDVTLTAATAQF